MAFSNLSQREKTAFFSLLDEYFTSRPDILGHAQNQPSEADASSNANSAAASAVHRAMADNPEATGRLFSAGLKHAVPKSSPYASAAASPAVGNAMGRVAAASRNWSSAAPKEVSPPSSGSTSPPVHAPPEHRSTPSDSGRGLVPIRRFGDVDTSSAKNMFSSIRNSTANKTALPPPVAPPVPAAFAAKKSTFAPPPVRRVTSAEPEPEPEPEPEVQGEWAEAQYDYTSAEPGDLELKADQRVLVTDRTSADWWTGEVDGRSGLFPASYVKLL
ncbi:SH3-domain-containing protein [Artomyces pyxidatus]|uniref:SH3-domain-containing protein n=1 Tax=Artomyces pyxidatus TaxID=48021 RepID=A0ACB8T9A0_9AGAM|nr:SH3-domain-containing protein [Artomyces pyxidatus]